MKVTKSCRCTECISACKRNPGVFAPGEAEEAAKLLGMSFEEFKEKYLILDYWTNVDTWEDIFVYSPKKVYMDSSHRVASFGSRFEHSPCVFLTQDEKCMIHEAKPMECARAYCCNQEKTKEKSLFEEIKELWEKEENPLKVTN